MNFLETLPIILVIIGVIINLIFGALYKTNFVFLMVKSIILTIGLSACGIFASEVLKKAQKNDKLNKKVKTQPSVFDAHIPSITHEEFKNLNDDEDGFQEMNPAALYKKNTAIKK